MNLACLVALVISAASPQFPYQGRLDKNGVPQTGSFDFTFTIYDAPTGGSLLWTDSFTGVKVVGGAFSVKLGGGAKKIDDTVLASPQLYLEVSVEGTPLAGRQQLLHVPYAANSSGDFRVNGSLIVGAMPDGGALVTDGGFVEVVKGPMQVTTPTSSMTIGTGGNTIDSVGPLSLQPNGGATTFGGNGTFNGSVTASNVWVRVYDGTWSVTTGTPLSVNVPTTAWAYKVFWEGKIFSSLPNLDVRAVIRLNGLSANYRSFFVTDGDSNFYEQEFSGFYIGRTFNYSQMDLVGEMTIYKGANSSTLQRGPTETCSGVISDGTANSVSGISRCSGVLYQFGLTNNIQVAITNPGLFTAHFTVYALQL